MFLVCVVFVVPNASHEQDRTAEAQTFQRMHHQRWVGRPSERCLDATSSRAVCVAVGVRPKMNHEHWVGREAERCLDARSSVGGGAPPPPGTPFSVRWQGPDTVCVGRTLTSVRSKKYMEKVCNGFLTILWLVLLRNK